jgi:hypothetical protein
MIEGLLTNLEDGIVPGSGICRQNTGDGVSEAV